MTNLHSLASKILVRYYNLIIQSKYTKPLRFCCARFINVSFLTHRIAYKRLWFGEKKRSGKQKPMLGGARI